MSVVRFAYWVCAVAAACCFGYAAYILLAWPDEPLDPRRTGMMAEVTLNRVAAFALHVCWRYGRLGGMAFAHRLRQLKGRRPKPTPRNVPCGDWLNLR